MDERALYDHLRDVYHLRLQPAMRQYLMEKMLSSGGGGESVAVIGGHARTGRAVRAELPIAALAQQFPFTTSELS